MAASKRLAVVMHLFISYVN